MQVVVVREVLRRCSSWERTLVATLRRQQWHLFNNKSFLLFWNSYNITHRACDVPSTLHIQLRRFVDFLVNNKLVIGFIKNRTWMNEHWVISVHALKQNNNISCWNELNQKEVIAFTRTHAPDTPTWASSRPHFRERHRSFLQRGQPDQSVRSVAEVCIEDHSVEVALDQLSTPIREVLCSLRNT